MTTYFKGLLESEVSVLFENYVVRGDQIDKYKYRGVKRVLLSIMNTPLLTAAVLVALLRYRPAIVHIQTNSGPGYFEKSLIALLARLFFCKVLMHVHGGGFMDFYRRSPAVIKWLIWHCIQLNHYIVAPSKKMQETFLSLGVPSEKIKLLENAVMVPQDCIWDYRTDEKEKNGVAGKVTVLFLNSITRAKGIFEFAEGAALICRELPKVNFRIAGVMSPDGEAVKKLIIESDTADQIEFIGPVSDEQKARELRLADIYVLPSYIEDLPYGLLEAMACGLPCLAAAVGGVPSLIEDEKSGLLIPPMDVQALVSGLKKLINAPVLRKQLGIGGRQRVEKLFSWAQRAQEITAFYRSLLV
jgi:glycosyltransferase involved in cell wall biosynthesis